MKAAADAAFGVSLDRLGGEESAAEPVSVHPVALATEAPLASTKARVTYAS